MHDMNIDSEYRTPYEEEESAALPFKRLTFLTVLLAVLKRPWIILITTVTIMLPLIYYVFSLVPMYKSTTTVMVAIKGGSLLAEVSLGTRTDSNQRSMKYYTSLLDSRVFLKSISDYTFENYPSLPKDSLTNLYLKSRIDYLTNPREEGFISVFAVSPDPKLAYFLAKTALLKFKERSIALERQEAQDVSNFIEDQLLLLNQQMMKAENELQSFLSQKKLVVEDLEVGVSKQLFEIESKLSEAQANFEMVQINIKSFQDRLNKLLEQLSSEQKMVDDFATRVLRSRLDALNKQLQDTVSAKNTPEQIQVIYNEMNLVRNELVNSLTSRSENSKGENDESRITLQKIEEQLESAQLEREKFRNQVNFHQIQLERFKAEHPDISKDILDFASLVRAKDVLDKTTDILLEKREESRIRVASEHGGIKVIDDPQLPSQPIEEQESLKLIIGAIFSVFLGIFVCVLIDRFDNAIRDEKDISPNINLSVLGTLPVIQSNIKNIGLNPAASKEKASNEQLNREKLLTNYSEKSPIAESYRSMKTSLLFLSQDMEKNVFVISSANPSEGKSLVTMNLGISFAQGGNSILVIDCDFRRPVQHKLLNMERKPGLTNHLFGEIDLDDIIRETPIPNLSLITAGTSPPNPAEMLQSRKMKEFLEVIRHRYDIVLIDTPPIMACVDSRVVGQSSDAMIVVAKVESTKISDLEHVVQQARKLNVNVVGVILNQVEFRYGYPYYYAYRYYNPYSYYYGNYNYYYYYEVDGDKKIRKTRKESKSGK